MMNKDVYIGRKSSFFHTPLHSTPPLGGSRRNSATPFGMELEKLEWLGYPMVKKIEDMFIRFDVIHERDGRTDGNRVTAYTALMHSIARKKIVKSSYLSEKSSTFEKNLVHYSRY